MGLQTRIMLVNIYSETQNSELFWGGGGRNSSGREEMLIEEFKI